MAELSSKEIRKRLFNIENKLSSKENRTDEEEKILQAIQKEDFTSSGALGQILQGLQEVGIPSEEITSYTVPRSRTNILSDALVSQNQLKEQERSGFEPPSNRDLALALQRKNLETYTKNNPVKSFLLNTTGAILPLAAASRISPSAGPKLTQTIGNLARTIINPKSLRQAGASGGGLSVVGGINRGEDNMANRISSSPLNLIAGVGLGVAGKVGSDIISGTLKKYIFPPNPKRLGIKQARDFINEALKDENLTPSKAIEILMKKKNSNFTMADLGNNPTQLLSVINALPGPGSKQAKDFLIERNQGKIKRLYHLFDNVKSGSWIDEFKALQSTMKRKGDRFYNVAYNGKKNRIDLNTTIQKGDEIFSINDLINRPSFQKAFNSAKIQAKEDGKRFGDFNIAIVNGVTRIVNSKGKVINKLPTRILQSIKEGYDEIIFQGKGADRSLGKKQIASITNNKNLLLDIIDAQNPAYKKARNEWSGDVAILDALDYGRNIKSKKYEYSELLDIVNKMSNSEKKSFRLGAINAYIDLIENKGTNTNIANAISKSVNDKRLLKLTWGGTDESFEQFWGKLTDEITIAQTAQTVLGNSATAVRTNFNKKIMDKGDDYAVNNTLTQLIGKVLNKEAQTLDNTRIRTINKEMTRILLTTAKKPEQLQLIKKQLDMGASLKELAVLYPELLAIISKIPFSPSAASVLATDESNVLSQITGGNIKAPFRSLNMGLK